STMSSRVFKTRKLGLKWRFVFGDFFVFEILLFFKIVVPFCLPRRRRCKRGSILRARTVVLTLIMPETHATAYDSKIEGNVIFTRFDAALNWVRKNSLWPMPMGLACCAIELMAAAASRFDIARFAAEVMRFSPRQ